LNRLFLLGVLALVLTACGQGGSEPGISIAKALSLAPEDPALADQYRSSCRACHAASNSGAPMTGSLAAWKPRLDKGLDVLVEHTITGFKGMPPMGLCSDCSESELRALIEFMATPPQEDGA